MKSSIDNSVFNPLYFVKSNYHRHLFKGNVVFTTILLSGKDDFAHCYFTIENGKILEILEDKFENIETYERTVQDIQYWIDNSKIFLPEN